MNHPQLEILITHEELTQFVPEIFSLHPLCSIHTPAEWKADGALVEKAEIVFGTLEPQSFRRARCLKWLQTHSDDTSWVHHMEIRTHTAVLTHANVEADAIAEHLMAGMLALSRGLHRCIQRPGSSMDPLPGKSFCDTLDGKTLCLVGTGTAAMRLATPARLLGMRVIGVGDASRHTPAFDRVHPWEELHLVLGQGDVVALALPKSKPIEFGEKEFASMRRGAIFLSADKSDRVDSDSLIKCLRKGNLKAASLNPADPADLDAASPIWKTPNLLVTPYPGERNPVCLERVAEVFLANLQRYLKGDPLNNCIDKN